MENLNYPKVHEYELPRKNILVLSCMDLRLTDNLVDFLHFDNLHNRYDHFILAGTSLLCTEKLKTLFSEDNYTKYSHWKKSLDDHLQLAISLHKIKDVYIVEHQDCGAYANLLDPAKVDLSTKAKEKECHTLFASSLATEIHKKVWTEKGKDGRNESYQLGVHCFFIDLRGNVELLKTLGAVTLPEKKLV